ncbi:MAG: hypothetical protein JWO56_1006 [Acidobacteria bacterium]|nr:hypothetical protein [Acidobacteriota bacterium]
MKVSPRFALAAAAMFLTASLGAQTITLPPSGDNEASTITQGIGPVTVAISYHSPKVIRGTNDRRGKIWGTLVPYGLQNGLGYGTCTQCPWRGGANENTTFAVSHDVKIDGQPLKAGTYGLHFIPDPAEWTIVFSKNASSWGSFFYDPAEDALRVKVKPGKTDFHDYLTYEFTDREPAKATAVLKWDELQLPWTITVDDPNEVWLASISNELRGGGSGDYHNWLAASRFAQQNKVGLPQALQWAQMAVNGTFIGNANFNTLSNLADAQQANGLTAEAAKTRELALNDASASATDLHQYARQLQLQGKNDEAAKVFELNAKRHPNVWPVNVGLARASTIHGKKADALKYAKVAMTQAPDDASKRNLETLIKQIEEGKPQ